MTSIFFGHILSMKARMHVSLQGFATGHEGLLADGLDLTREAADSQAKKIASSTLFENKKALLIEHADEVYTLRVTKQNKLILTK